MTDVVVLGAGVLGLTIAYQLSSDEAYRVHVIAKSLPVEPDQDYTSQYAGASWRSVCANDDAQMIEFEKATLLYLRQFSEEHPELVNKCTAYDVFDPRKHDATDIIRLTMTSDGEVPWFAPLCKELKVTDAKDLPAGAQHGLSFDAVTVNAPEYVKWLYEQCLRRKVDFEKRTINSLDELDPKYQYIMNCTGLGARILFGDEKLYPTRGQTVLVKNTTNIVDTHSRSGQDVLSYIIPRPGNGGLIIGGCQQPNNWSYEVDMDLAERMLTWAKILYPGLFPADHEFEVIRHNVGLRPSRVGGPRVETEAMGDRTVVHGYGIGGWGFQSSWGIGLKMASLLRVAVGGESAGRTAAKL